MGLSSPRIRDSTSSIAPSRGLLWYCVCFRESILPFLEFWDNLRTGFEGRRQRGIFVDSQSLGCPKTKHPHRSRRPHRPQQRDFYFCHPCYRVRFEAVVLWFLPPSFFSVLPGSASSSLRYPNIMRSRVQACLRPPSHLPPNPVSHK